MKIRVRVAAWSVLAAISLMQLAQASDQSSPTPLFDQVEKWTKDPSTSSLDDLLAKMPADWFKQYSLIYQSRSLQGGSLEEPRVILSDTSKSLYFTFQGAATSDGEDTIEAIETFGLKNPRFFRIHFDRSKLKAPRVERDPKVCIACHQTGTDGSMGFIWDSYPQWPGVYGSAHNGYLYAPKPPNGGMSRVPTAEFELLAFRKLRKSQPTHSRYKFLQDFQKQDFDLLGIMSLDLLAQFQDIHFNRAWNHATEITKDFSTLRDLIKWANLSHFDPRNAQNPLITQAEQEFPAFKDRLVKECKASVLADIDHLRFIYDMYGTSTDKYIASLMFPVLKGVAGEDHPGNPITPGFVSFCGYSDDDGHGKIYSALNGAYAVYKSFGKSWTPQRTISTILARSTPYLISGGSATEFMNVEVIDSLFKRARSAEQLAASVPLVFSKFSHEVIEADDYTKEWLGEIEATLSAKLRSLKDPTAQDWFKPEIYPGLSDRFWAINSFK